MTMQSGQETTAPAGTKGKPFQAQFEMLRLQKQPRDDAPEKMTGVIYRDSEGRERIEEHVEVEPGIMLKVVHITDPVEKMTYTLEAASKTILRKEPWSQGGFRMLSVGGVGIMLPNAPPNAQPDLGSKEIEGLKCDGYQIKMNEATAEFWFSRELNQLVFAKTVSEGEESTWRYFNFRLVEPDSSLFTVPADYKDASAAGGVEIEFPDPGTAGDNANEVKIKLLDSGTTCGVKTKEDRDCAALFRGAQAGDTAGVKEVLAKGVDVNAKDYDGTTALIHAAASGHTETVKALLAEGADINARKVNGHTALMRAAYPGHAGTVQVLLAAGADVNAKIKHGDTALFFATWSGHSNIVEALLAAGADVNAKTEDGSTALMFAVGIGRPEIVQMLLAHGADVNVKKQDGQTALQMASRAGHSDIVELLKKAGAKE